MAHVGQHLGKGDGRALFQAFHAAPKKGRKTPDSALGFIRVTLAQVEDDRKGVVTEAELKLAEHHINLELCKNLQSLLSPARRYSSPPFLRASESKLILNKSTRKNNMICVKRHIFARKVA